MVFSTTSNAGVVPPNFRWSIQCAVMRGEAASRVRVVAGAATKACAERVMLSIAENLVCCRVELQACNSG